MKVTVESCLKRVDNRFKLVLLASKRAKDLDRGARSAVPRDDDKPTIIAMREIAEDAISLDSLENITRSNIVNRNNEMQVEDDFDETNNLEGNDDIGDDMEDDLDEDDEMEEDMIDEAVLAEEDIENNALANDNSDNNLEDEDHLR